MRPGEAAAALMRGVAHGVGRLYLAAFSRQYWRDIPRPAGQRSVVRGVGPDPDRVLLSGSGSAVGWGVLTHDLALGGYLARHVSAATGRGTDVEVIAGPRLSMRSMGRVLTPETIARYDAIVLTLGTREAFEWMPTSTWRALLTRLLDQIAAPGDHQPSVVVVGAEEITTAPLPRWLSDSALQRAQNLNAASRQVIAARDNVRYVDSAMPVGAREIGLVDADKAALYSTAAAAIVPVLAALLDGSPYRRSLPVDDGARQRAIDHLRGLPTGDARLGALLMTLRDMFDARSVDLFFVDHDVVTMLAATRGPLGTRPREGTASAEALDHRRGLIVPDLSLDDRFNQRAEVIGPPHLRFYAAHPVESPEGHPVAVLTVVDAAPRVVSPAEAALLRQFAIRAGAILFEGY